MNYLLWALQILLGLLFVFSGVMKFIMPYEEMIKGSPVYLPKWFFLFIGVCEILGGIGLVLPWLLKIKRGLTPLAAALLVIIMIGATVISVMGPWPAGGAIPFVFGL
ncbi:MAG TPA: DoxX family protein, partial [Pyrinomonadaceae bacterium]|nr:DoxX family protein [Pyrinomonadaceae bacterium]